MFRIVVLALLTSLSTTLRVRTDHQRHDSHGDRHRDRSAERCAARCDGAAVRAEHDGRADAGERQPRALSLRRHTARRIQAGLRAPGLCDAQPRRRTPDGRLHRHDQHADGRRDAHRERAGHRRLAGRRHTVDDRSTPPSTRRRSPTCRARATTGRFCPKRRASSWQRIDVGGSAAGTQTTYFVYGTTGQNRPMVEGINSTEGTGSLRQLRRLRVVRGGLDRQRRVERGEPGARRLHAC